MYIFFTFFFIVFFFFSFFFLCRSCHCISCDAGVHCTYLRPACLGLSVPHVHSKIDIFLFYPFFCCPSEGLSFEFHSNWRRKSLPNIYNAKLCVYQALPDQASSGRTWLCLSKNKLNRHRGSWALPIVGGSCFRPCCVLVRMLVLAVGYIGRTAHEACAARQLLCVD